MDETGRRNKILRLLRASQNGRSFLEWLNNLSPLPDAFINPTTLTMTTREKLRYTVLKDLILRVRNWDGTEERLPDLKVKILKFYQEIEEIYGLTGRCSGPSMACPFYDGAYRIYPALESTRSI